MQEVDKLPGDNYFLTWTEPAVIAVNKIGMDKPQGWFRIRCDIKPERTDFTFAWDDVSSMDDFLIPIPNSPYELIMDAVSISYILDEYLLDHDGLRFIISRNPEGARRHQTKQ